MHPVDCEVGNWFTSTSPLTIFTSRLIAARALPDGGRLTLLNGDFTRRSKDGQATVQRLGSHGELRAVLAEHFGIVLPMDTRLSCAELDLVP